ncbi:hypothetical protein GCM10010317_076750 [Streptomyces mirabilis]|uniref:hypothetical protein n=1 Tax=Streptomyces mirabilis TaxID=68239 RepID=UPI0019CF044F|nr:hypothetical protein [Streptomyces mirabilis]GHD70124.1 hypothetical protein GCM10010317_076750 [Streptomyces mirabilis]
MHRGEMSWRRLRVLIQHLPPESATMTALRNAMSDEELAEQADKGEPEKGRWSQQDLLLAVVADRLAELSHLYVGVNRNPKTAKPKPPEPIRRPGAKAPKAKARLSDEQAERLFHLINGGAA